MNVPIEPRPEPPAWTPPSQQPPDKTSGSIWLGFGLGWHGVGIWIGLAAGLAIVSVLMLARWLRRGRLRLTPSPL